MDISAHAPVLPPLQQQHEQQQQHRSHSHHFSATFSLPGLGVPVRVVSSSSTDPAVLGLDEVHIPPGMDEDPFASMLHVINSGGRRMSFSQEYGPPPGFNPLASVFAFHQMFPGIWDQEQMDTIMSRIMEEHQPQSVATSKRVREALPRLKVRAKDDEKSYPDEGLAVAKAGEPCSVCHEDFEEAEEVIELPCQHCYHSDCILPWLETHNTCPVCRLDLPAEESGPQANHNHQNRSQTSSDRNPVVPPSSSSPFAGLTGLIQNVAERWAESRSPDPGRQGSGMMSSRPSGPREASELQSVTLQSSGLSPGEAAAAAAERRAQCAASSRVGRGAPAAVVATPPAAAFPDNSRGEDEGMRRRAAAAGTGLGMAASQAFLSMFNSRPSNN